MIVTESFARRFGVRAGERIVLEGREGPREMTVEAVFYDYTSEHGVIMMDRGTYLALSGDSSVNTVGVYLEPGHPQGDATVAAIQRLAAEQGYPVQLRAELHRGIRTVFDATFAVTRSLRLLAVITAFFGIAGALLTLFTERRREFGVFRALGFSSGQVVGVTFLEGLGLGLASFALSAVSGTVVAVLLIRVINLRSFHWTVFFHPAWETYAVAAALAVAASLAAAAYPAWLVLAHLPPDPAAGRMMQAAEKGPSAALRSSRLPAAATRPPQSPGRRAPCTWTFLSSLPVQRGVRISGERCCWRGSPGACCCWRRRGRAAGEWAVADGTRTWSFPRDHGAHPEYRTEWWYFTGILAAADGRRFGYQLTFFRQGIAPVAADPGNPWSVRDLHLAHFTLTDVAAGGASALPSACRGPVRASRGPRSTACAPGSSTGRPPPTGNPSRWTARDGDVAINLTLRPRRPPVLHGSGGLSRKGPAPGQASWYASITDLETTGTVRPGDGGEVAVRGASWFDHEFGSGQLADDLAGWDWFGLRLSDGRALMIYRLRRRDGTAAPASAGTLVDADGAARHLARDEVAIEPLATLAEPAQRRPLPVAVACARPRGRDRPRALAAAPGPGAADRALHRRHLLGRGGRRDRHRRRLPGLARGVRRADRVRRGHRRALLRGCWKRPASRRFRSGDAAVTRPLTCEPRGRTIQGSENTTMARRREPR